MKFAMWTAVLALGASSFGCGDDKETSRVTDAGASDTQDDSEDGVLLGDDDLEGEDPATCRELGIDCGQTADGRGGVVDCGGCEDGALCSILEPNVCTSPSELVTPLTEEEACLERECGPAGDGVGGTVECGECGEGESCGAAGPARCGRASDNDENNCPARIPSCAEVGATCGVIGNGCGGTLDCDEETGGCGPGEVCGIEEHFQCGEAPECQPLDPAVACEGKCGRISNGCGEEVGGGLIDCGALPGHECPDGTVCGGAGVPNECGVGTCDRLSAAEACAERTCGVATDGCDGTRPCGSCDANAACVAGTCEVVCEPIPLEVACEGKDCGLVGDGCGGSHDCGGCAADESCGQFDPFACSPTPPAVCVPFTDAEACSGKQCGEVFDGCGSAAGNRIDCGSCSSGEICGIVAPFQCDDPDLPDCTPWQSCAAMGWECGTAVDPCGNLLDCADEDLACDAQETCVGGIDGPTRCVSGTEGEGACDVCDAVPDCSQAAQETALTGRVITPGADDGDNANQLGVPNAFVYILRHDDENELPPITSGIPSQGGQYQTACDRCTEQDLGPVLVSTVTNAFGEFRLEGKIPVGQSFVLVVKTGKWRRAVRIPALAANSACATTALAPSATRLPRSMSDGLAVNIPRVAVSTGLVDAMECVLFKMGVSETEFAQPGATGTAPARVHMYRSQNNGGARTATGFTSAQELYGTSARLFGYDMLVFDCESIAYEHNADDPRVREYVNRGGRLFASHWSYSWLHDNGQAAYSAQNPYDTGLGPSSVWGGTSDEPTDTAWVSVGRPRAIPAKIQNFADWLEREGAATQVTPGRYALDIVEPRDLSTRLGAASEEFVYRLPDAPTGVATQCKSCASILQPDNCASSPNCVWNSGSSTCGFANDCRQKSQTECTADPACAWNGNCIFAQVCSNVGADDQDACLARPQCGWDASSVQQYAFNTPYGAPPEAICGRVAYSGFHVVATDAAGYANAVFPAHCTGDLSSQEKVLAYMLLDLGGCVTPGVTKPVCTPLDASDCGGRCGSIADGCGGVIDCPNCPAGELCLPGGVCAPLECQPTTCEREGKECGLITDGCDSTLDCGECPADQVCGLLVPNQCAGPCTPIDEATACDGKCGYVSNECSGVYECGDCPPGLTCVDNECVDRDCDPLTACPAGFDCGSISDGCDGALDCGECEPPELCGGAGMPNECGLPECPALDCAAAGAECGFIGDGCGQSLDCGECPPGQLCGIEAPNRCDGCEPRTCEDAGAECGLIGNGCGVTVDCGPCPEGETCGAAGPNLCGDGPSCPERTCDQEMAECGLIGDGCGGTVDCGPCPEGQVCGIDTPFQCGDPPECMPRTCEDAEAECGNIGDNCGELLDCGDCPMNAPCRADNTCPTGAR